MANGLAQRAQGQAVQQQGNEKSIDQLLKEMQPQFQMAMPRGAEAVQLVRDALTVIRQTPKLLECDRASLFGSLMTCAQLGLRPGVGALGHAYVIPFKGQAQFILGYQGMLELANRSNEVEGTVARIVYANDEFRVDYGTDKLTHVPAMSGRGEPIGYYAKFYRRGSDRPVFEWMSVEDAKEHMQKFAMAKTRDGRIVGPWVQHFDSMALKTVVRKLFKWMPRTTQMQLAVIADETVRVDAAPNADLAQVAKGVDFDERGENAALVDEGEQPPADYDPRFDD
ncbi:RecT-like ssDNA annealing protein [Arthrobacter phage Piccoletto]|uniref:RecT-like DNA pairing protein n=3 Tax=Jawnskivirus TaxID=3425003 RepID=A0A222ZKJ6_9CAUD|nr:RecT-like ssDNA annealing protein [Arthrobacter phage Jawnski]YP_009609974.1 RecT-like ssDNA annealing protein [Arthrobacter phage Beans]YP_009612412.1 RecT-like ssDNA annealing protein [Arthrobacter phage Piccoletto]UVK62285.1 RecT-like DNA pairing protein [Arthrobacter phage NathanVaag]ALY09363.1 RecT-like DNA pairing protein [Arthrobacter phage Jawnski]ASR80664.1 RecT-like DNA pairing protein [Arthrobacter phage Piccoletto]ASR84711.1 RecT-like DNA pairing protein [Arthrobacter phage Bea